MSTSIRLLGAPLSAAMILAAFSPAAPAQFTAGNLVVYRVGDGPNSLAVAGSIVALAEFKQDGTASGFAMTFPNTAGGDLLIANGLASTEGMIQLGNSGRTLAATGYRAPLGGSGGLNLTSSAAVNRTVALVDGQGSASYTYLTDFASGSNPRSAFTADGTNIWVAGGAGGIRYTTAGSTVSTQLSTTPTDVRTVQGAAGQLYVSSGAGTIRVATVGAGMPTASGQTTTNLPGLPTSGSPYQFFMARVGNPSFAGPNVLYVADENAFNGTGVSRGQIQKFAFDGTNWSAAGQVIAGVSSAANTGIRGLTGVVTGDNQIALFGSTGGVGTSGGGAIFSFTDSAAQAGSISGSAITLSTVSSPSKFAYRGIAFAPAKLDWSGATNNSWDLTSANFTNSAPATAVPQQTFVNAYAANFGNITADTNITVGSGINPAAVNVTNSSNTYTFTNDAGSNGIQGLASLVKSGQGTLVLGSPNTHSGDTQVNGGTLVVKNSSGSATGIGTVFVNSGGTLRGTGTISGPISGVAINVAPGGTLAPGGIANTGMLTVNNSVTMASGSTFNLRILGGSVGDGTSAVSGYDRLTVTSGTVDLGSATLVVSGGYTPAANDALLLIDNKDNGGAGTLINTFLNLPNGSIVTVGGVDWTIYYGSAANGIAGAAGSNDVVLVPVPEPTSILLACAAAAGLYGLARRARKPHASPKESA